MMDPSVSYSEKEALELEWAPPNRAYIAQAGHWTYTIPAEHVRELYESLGRFIARGYRLKHPDPSFPHIKDQSGT